MIDINDYDLFYEPKKTIVIVSGYFDPLNGQGHIDLLKAAKNLRQNVHLIVGINSDEACYRKKGQPAFMRWDDKAKIIRELKCVDEVCNFDDSDGTACLLISYIYNFYKISIENGTIDIVFANGGDRRPDGTPIPEEKWCREQGLNIEFAYGVGGTEKNGSSSDYLRNWFNNTIDRYRTNLKSECDSFILKDKY